MFFSQKGKKIIAITLAPSIFMLVIFIYSGDYADYLKVDFLILIGKMSDGPLKSKLWWFVLKNTPNHFFRPLLILYYK